MKTNYWLVMVGLFMVLLICDPAAAWEDDTELFQGKWKEATAKNNGGDIFEGKRDKMFAIIKKGAIRVVIEGTKSEQAAAFARKFFETGKNKHKYRRLALWIVMLFG